MIKKEFKERYRRYYLGILIRGSKYKNIAATHVVWASVNLPLATCHVGGTRGGKDEKIKSIV